MGVRSELLFAAQKRILNPFLLCAATSARARQLMVGRDGRAAFAELVDDALGEIAARALEFGRGKQKRGDSAGTNLQPTSGSQTEATRDTGNAVSGRTCGLGAA